MGTGIKPVETDYDIDVGVVFAVESVQKHDPVQFKELVFNAVWAHTKDVRFRRPCVTVYYTHQKEPRYHVDLAVYAKEPNGKTYLAFGKQHSSADQRKWVPSNPRELFELIEKRHAGDSGEQFRRVLRYLKRWKDVSFPAEGRAAPTGIALTACALQWFQPTPSLVQPDDAAALATVLSGMTSGFGWQGRLAVKLPVAPGNDLFERMPDQQMLELRQKIESLRAALDAASRQDERGAAARLAKEFGRDFPTD
jgi:hypothetical protein